jgi:hypothetical protein
MDGKIIKLSTPIDVFGRSVTEITLREPRGGLYLRLGDPRLLVSSSDRGGYYVEQPEVIKAYLDALVEPVGSAEQLAIFTGLSLADQMRLKWELFGFFSKAAADAAAAS